MKLFAVVSLVALTSLAWGQEAQTPKSKPTVSAAPAKEIPLDEASADKFLLAVERDSHANDLVRVAYNEWAKDPSIVALFADKDAKDRALQETATELIKKAGLDPKLYQVDADGANKPPKPKFVLRPVEVKK
jgi:hypothetical protein